MWPLSLIVFINLFLIPIFLHPLTVCRHLIHIGHEPFQPEPLRTYSYESQLYNFMEHRRSYMSVSSVIKHKNLFQRILNYILQRTKSSSRKRFYPNLIEYTKRYIHDHDSSIFIQPFLSMYISYFLLTYFSSLVHVYRISRQRKAKSLDDIRSRAQQLIESSYGRWILHALFWKCIGVLISHIFHVMAVKILMQILFMSYGHFHLQQASIYSSWNLHKNFKLIYKHEGWEAFSNGIISRMIYELSITVLPRLIWWPFRSLFIHSTIKSYFRASSIELYFIQCICENLLRWSSVYLQVFARMTTLEIVNQMHEPISIKKYPLLSLLRHHHRSKQQPWSFPISLNLIDAELMIRGLSVFFRQAN